MYIIHDGTCQMFRDVFRVNSYGNKVVKQVKIVEMTTGDIFGEETLVFGRNSTCSIVVKSSTVSCYVIDPKFFEKKLRLIVPQFINLCKKKYEFFDMIWDKVQKIDDVKDQI